MASYCYHKVNALKWRIMNCFYHSDKTDLTCREISDLTGVSLRKIESAMSYYHQRKYGYFMRLRKKADNHTKAFRYKMNGYGYKWYGIYQRRIKIGVDLRCSVGRKKVYRMKHFRGLKQITVRDAVNAPVTPEEIDDYIGLTKAGVVDMGITEEHKLEIAGIKTS